MHRYTHLIPENIAPAGAARIGVFGPDGSEVASIPLGRLKPPGGAPLYRFMALSDIHLTDETANEDFQRAMAVAESLGCAFTCIAGDLTVAGTDSELALYRSLARNCRAISGNHETAHGNYITDASISPYTGDGLHYSFAQGDDVFVMVGYYGGYHEGNGGWRSDEFVSRETLQWLYETLEANRNKRCFVFTHVLPHEHGVGNPNGLYKSALIWQTMDGGVGQAFMSLLRHYKNIVFFHGHSHTRFGLQELDARANYSNENGYRSVHIPSLALPRDVSADGTELEKIYAESEGYVVDVYDGCIVLNGRDFVDNDADGHWLGLATYKVDTALVEVPAGTFADPTGIIET